MNANSAASDHVQAGAAGLLVTEEALTDFYGAVSRATALGYFRGPHGPLTETAWLHVAVDQLERMERAATALLTGDGRYLRWFRSLLTAPAPAASEAAGHSALDWQAIRPQHPMGVLVAGILLDRLLGAKDLVWAQRAAGYYGKRTAALDRALANARGVLAHKVPLREFAELVRGANPLAIAHGHGGGDAPVPGHGAGPQPPAHGHDHRHGPVADTPSSPAHAPRHGADHPHPGGLSCGCVPLENAWTALLDATRQHWDAPVPALLGRLADVLAGLPAEVTGAPLPLVELAGQWDHRFPTWPPVAEEHPIPPEQTEPGVVADRNRCVPGQPQHGGRWEIARVDATEVEEKCAPAASLDRASSRIYGWAGDQLIKAANEWTEIQLCVERVDTRKCVREEDQGYNQCTQERDDGYNQCTQERDDGYNACAREEDRGYNRCCDWWPCSWACKALVWVSNIVCVAWTWVSNIVCVAWTWISHIVCVAWTWIKKMVCVAWEYIKAAACIIGHGVKGLGHLIAGLGGAAVAIGVRTAGGFVNTICKLFGARGTTRQSARLKVVGIHIAVLRTNKVLIFSYDEGIQPVNASTPADFTAIGDSDRGLSALWDFKTGKATYVPLQRNLFCAHHSFTAEGDLFTASGQFPLPGLLKSLFPPKLLAPGADRDVHIFDVTGEQWRRLPDMEKGRWYPTCATLPDGRVLIMSGTNGYATSPGFGRGIQDTWEIAIPATGAVGPPQPFGFSDGQGFRNQHFYHLYPFLHVLSSGKVFVHFKRTTALFDPQTLRAERIAAGAATAGETGETRHLYSRSGPGPGTSVLLPLKPRRTPAGDIEYPAGRILILGGGGAEKEPEPPDPTDSKTRSDGTSGYQLHSSTPATNSAEILDLDEPAPEWRFTGEFMKNGRVMPDSILLPTGKVLVVGGGRKGQSGGLLAHFTSVDQSGQPDKGATDPVLEPELFDPETETWEQLCPRLRERLYHTTAALLPDARVLVAGHDGALNMPPYDASQYELEVFSPPYLFNPNGQLAVRPDIVSAPAEAVYGQSVTIRTRSASDIASVALIRPTSVTHQINSDQRYVELPILDSSTDMLSVRLPPNGGVAPPGFYMLFLVNRAGVPSEASWIRIGTR